MYNIYTYIYVCVYIYMCVCIYIYLFIYLFIYLILLASMAISNSCFQDKTQLLVLKQISQKKNSPDGPYIMLRISSFLLRSMFSFRS